MKKLPLIVILWLVPLLAHAQPKLGIALKGGGSGATWNIENRTHRYGFSGGVASYLQWSLFDRLSLGGQMEALYTPRGADVVFEGEYLGTVRQHYLDVTIAIRPETRLGPAGVYLLLGGSWNLLLNAVQVTEASGSMENDITDVLARHDVALLVGVGVVFHLPAKKLGPFHLDTVFFEGRHDRGLIDIAPDNEDSIKNRTTSLMLGLSFALGSKAASAPSDPVATSALLRR